MENLQDQFNELQALTLSEKMIKACNDPAKKKVLSKLNREMRRTIELEKKYYIIKEEYRLYLEQGGERNERLEESLACLKEVTE